ncbi:MAG: SAM-dependent methyltransferase [Planctomycetes bacterium]|nr:SAM-dependent methyltransferase [Planctomycetota bacterium]
MTSSNHVVASSFRDPNGFVFVREGTIYRQVNKMYKPDYDFLMESGLYQSLADAGLIVAHEEADIDLAESDSAYKILKPDEIPFISYPYEWSFGQLKDAALTTLRIQKTAFDHGMTLKDSSAYNIQFIGCKPVFIDTLSFERYKPGQPWPAYRQFCQHFLAPLALMACRDIRLSQLLRVYIDGVELDLASKILPARSWLSFSLLSHIHLHSRSQRQFSGKQVNTKSYKVSKFGFMGIIDSLENAVRKLKWQPKGTEWGDYYDDTNYSDEATTEKAAIVKRFLKQIQPETTWDLGANTGVFSRIAAEMGSRTVAFDIDPAAVEKGYLAGVNGGAGNILPLVLDLTNPSGGLGWANNERMSLLERGPAQAVLALALIHHLAISNNLPMQKIASFFRKLCSSLIIEFVPKQDSQVQRLLATREDIFPDYTKDHFEDAFKKHFAIDAVTEVAGSCRTMYLMRRLSE